MELIISFIAAGIALYAVLVQRKELGAQREELSKSAVANDKSQQSLNKQTELQALSSLLNAEIYLHEFNNKKTINEAQQKVWAAKNFQNIGYLKEKISTILDENS